MKPYRLWIRILICAAPLVFLLGVILFKDYMLSAANQISCPYYKYLGIYCPACGNTRSVEELLRGNILLSLRNNITPFVLLVVAIILYARLVLRAFGQKIAALKQSNVVLFAIIGIMLLYYVLRNFIPAIAPVI